MEADRHSDFAERHVVENRGSSHSAGLTGHSGVIAREQENGLAVAALDRSWALLGGVRTIRDKIAPRISEVGVKYNLAGGYKAVPYLLCSSDNVLL